MRQATVLPLVLLLLIASLALATTQAAVTSATRPSDVSAPTLTERMATTTLTRSAEVPIFNDTGGTTIPVVNFTRQAPGNTPSVSTSCTSAQKTTTTPPAATAMIRRVAGGVMAGSDVPQLWVAQLAAQRDRLYVDGITRSQAGFDDAGGFDGSAT